ncbi:MAG: hypothetical protein AMJ41_05120 [candidate division Zixibacteria bacterium DG_27]|nr:MAG: hypothetical protein AMJ41_05120 [candidate division Zixibacteria bacterium DG_27]
MFVNFKEQTCPYCGAKMELVEEVLQCPECFWRFRNRPPQESHLSVSPKPEKVNPDFFGCS